MRCEQLALADGLGVAPTACQPWLINLLHSGALALSCPLCFTPSFDLCVVRSSTCCGQLASAYNVGRGVAPNCTKALAWLDTFLEVWTPWRGNVEDAVALLDKQRLWPALLKMSEVRLACAEATSQHARSANPACVHMQAVHTGPGSGLADQLPGGLGALAGRC